MGTELKENIHVLDTLLENEKKSRTFTIFTIISICILLVVVFGLILSKKHDLDELDKKTHLVVNMANTIDSLKDLIVRLNQIHTTSGHILVPSNDNKYTLPAPAKDNDTKQNNSNSNSEVTYTCYIQFMPGFDNQLGQIKSILSKYKWYDNFVVKTEQLKDQSFNSYIKYFDQDNKALAEKMQKALSDGGLHLDREPVFVDIPAVSNNFEIWLGKAQKRTVLDILDDPRYQKNINSLIRQQ